MLILNDSLKNIRNDYRQIKSNSLSEARAWDICHDRFSKAINNSNNVNMNELALHLGMYLANWGMYRGSAFVRNYNYREFIPVVEMILEEQYKPLLDVEITQYANTESEELALLTDISKRIRDYLDLLRKKVNDSVKSELSQTLVTKILLATLACVPAYDHYFYEGITKENVAVGTFGEKSICQLAEFYKKNIEELESCRKTLINLENTVDCYPQAKLIDMIFFAAGNKKKL